MGRDRCAVVYGIDLGFKLVRASHRNREVTDSNPVEVLNFSGFSTKLQKLLS